MALRALCIISPTVRAYLQLDGLELLQWGENIVVFEYIRSFVNICICPILVFSAFMNLISNSEYLWIQFLPVCFFFFFK